MESQIDRIKKNILKIGLNYPFFLYLMSYCDFRREDRVPTMGVNTEGVVFYNEEFVSKMTNPEIRGVLLHEILHLVFNHVSKENNNKVLMIHNIACDVKVNEAIIRDLSNSTSMIGGNITLPNGCIKPETWRDECRLEGLKYTIKEVSKKNSDDIYKELMQKFGEELEQLKDMLKQMQFDVHEHGDTKDVANENISDKDRQDIGEFWKEKILEGYEYQKGKGNLPEFLEGLIKGLEMPKLDWRDIIRDRIKGYNISDYTWIKRHKNSRASGVYLPDNIKESVNCKVYFDTSGSVSTKELSQYLAEVKSIFNDFPNALVELVLFDAQIHSKQILEDDVTELKIIGRGGTEFKVVFDDDNETQDLILIFSDGECPYPDNRDNFHGEVLWCITQGRGIEYVKDKHQNDTLIEVEIDD